MTTLGVPDPTAELDEIWKQLQRVRAELSAKATAKDALPAEEPQDDCADDRQDDPKRPE